METAHQLTSTAWHSVTTNCNITTFQTVHQTVHIIDTFPSAGESQLPREPVETN